MTQNIKDIYIDEFKNDPVYKMVHDSRLEGYLFPDSLLEIDVNKTYSTIEVAKFINRKDSTIRNYFTNELIDYIQPEKVGNLYRLDYIMIFKIHMISLLFDKGKKSRVQIAYELGLKGSVKLGSNDGVPESIKEQNAKIEEIRKYIVIEKMRTTQLAKQNELQYLINQKQEKQIEYSELKAEKDNLSKSNQEENYFKALATAVEDLADLENTNMKLIHEMKEKKGFFAKWFGNNKKESTQTNGTAIISNTTEKISEILKGSDERDKVIQTKVSEINGSMERINKEIEDLTAKITDKINEIKNNEVYIENAEKELSVNENIFNNLLKKGED